MVPEGVLIFVVTHSYIRLQLPYAPLQLGEAQEGEQHFQQRYEVFLHVLLGHLSAFPRLQLRILYPGYSFISSAAGLLPLSIEVQTAPNVHSSCCQITPALVLCPTWCLDRNVRWQRVSG